jgi:biotin carboxyl carrier protein
MEIEEIEQLVGMIHEARISELAVTTDGSTVRLRKPLPSMQPVAEASAPSQAEKSQSPRPEAGKPAETVDTELFVSAPMVGIYHSAGNSMVRGVAVKAGQSVGAIESMKLMNDVISEHDGVIAEVLVEDGLPVEYGQTLFRLEVA